MNVTKIQDSQNIHHTKIKAYTVLSAKYDKMDGGSMVPGRACNGVSGQIKLSHLMVPIYKKLLYKKL